MQNFIYLYSFIFIAGWFIVTYFISRMGWAYLAAKYEYNELFTGTKVGIISARINKVDYRNSLILRYNESGIYLRPILIFRSFHKPILIPWEDIKAIRDRKDLFFTAKELSIGDPLVARISISKTTFNQLKDIPTLPF